MLSTFLNRCRKMDAVREDVTCWCRSVEGFGDASGAAPDAPLRAAPSFKTLLR